MTLEADDRAPVEPDDVVGDPPVDDEAAEPPTPEDVADPMAWSRPDWIAVATLFVASILLVSLHIRAYPTLSPIDELVHVDYLLKAGDLDPPERFDRIGVEALGEAACRTVDVFEYQGPPCGRDDYTPDDFGERIIPTAAINTATGQFPAYYVITGVPSRLAVDLGLVESEVTAARVIGGLWSGAAWSVIWAVLGLLRIPRVHRALGIGLLIATPLTLFHAATVNPDGVLLFTGASVVYATLRYLRGGLPWWGLLAANVVLTLFEPTTALAVVAAGVFLIVRVTLRPDRAPWDRVFPFVVLGVAGIQRLWFHDWARDRVTEPLPSGDAPELASGTEALATASPGLVGQAAGEVSVELDRLLQQLNAIYSPFNRGYVPPFWETELTIQLNEIIDWVLVATLFAAAAGFASLVRARGAEVSDTPCEPGEPTLATADADAAADVLWLSRIGLVATVLAGPLYTFSYAYFSDSDFNAPGRFGLPLVVFFVIGVAYVVTNRWTRGIVLGLAVGTVLNTLWHLVTV